MSLNEHAKRVYNVAPDPVRLTFDDGETYEFEMASAEFFQEDFQGEAHRADDDAEYRLVTDDGSLVVGRNAGEGWATFGVVVDVERA